ncbi:MAG: hypothetical protein WCJ09_06985 [Planctomycetota bacterium]
MNLQERLNSVNWADYESACGFDSREIPSLIVQLNDSDQATTMTAIERLWNVVCHQSNVGSNAVPVLPFLTERLETATSELQSEILDIIYSFACYGRACSERMHELEPIGWRKSLLDELIQYRPLFASFIGSKSEDLVKWGEMIDMQLQLAEACRYG